MPVHAFEVDLLVAKSFCRGGPEDRERHAKKKRWESAAKRTALKEVPVVEG